MLPDKPDRLLCIPPGKRRLLSRPFDLLAVFHDRDIKAPYIRVGLLETLIGILPVAIHIIRVRNAVIVIKAVGIGRVLRQMAQVPLADTCGAIVFSLQHFGYCQLFFGDSALRIREKHPS